MFVLAARLNAQDWAAMRIESVKLFNSKKGGKHPSQHAFKHAVEYIKYDKYGNVIEKGEYGLQHCITPHYTKRERAQLQKKGEIQMTLIRVADFKKVRTVEYSNYNKQNKVVHEEEWEFHFPDKKVLNNYSQFFYNDSSILNSKISYRSDSTINEKVDYIYDNCGNLRNEIISDGKSKDVRNEPATKIRVYNHLHELTLEIDSADGHKIITQHWYGFNNELIICYKDSIGNLIYTENIKKDFDGQPLTVSYRKADGRDATTNYFYDKWSNLKRIKHFCGTQLKWVNKYKYIYNGTRSINLKPRYRIPQYEGLY